MTDLLLLHFCTLLSTSQAAQLLVDAKEKEIEDARKYEIIARAQKMARESDDTLRRFKGSLMLSDVLDERARQLELKEMRRVKEKQRDAYFASLTVRNAEKMRLREEAEAAELEALNQKVQADQLSQLAAYKARWIANKQAEIAEGEAIKAAVVQRQKDAIVAEERKKEDAARRNRENTEANLKLEKIKEAIIAKEKLEQDAIVAYAATKELKLKQRKEAEEIEFKAKLAIRQKMIDKQVAALASFKNNEDTRLAGQQAQAEAAAEARAANDKAKQEQIQRELAQSRADALARKEAEKERVRKQDAEIETRRRRELAEWEAAQAAAKAARAQAELECQRQLAQQINAHEAKKEKEAADRAAYALELQRRGAAAEQAAREFASDLVQEYAAAGKNIAPLMRQLQKQNSKSLAPSK